VALLGGTVVLLVALASVAFLGGDDAGEGAAAPSTTAAATGSDGDSDGGSDGEAGSGLGGSATTTTAVDAPPATDGGTGDGPGPDRQTLSGSIVVDAPSVQEGPPEEGAPEPTPISEAAALACARVEFAVEAWDADDPGAYQTYLSEAMALAAEAAEPAIGAAVPGLEDASVAEDPAPGITRFLEACAASGYAV
jgi:hypothetical protein